MSGEQLNNYLVGLLGTAGMVAGVLFWRMFTRMERKIDEWLGEHLKCRERQEKTFMKKDDFDLNWRPGRLDLWKRINRHSHDPQTGKVVITEE